MCPGTQCAWQYFTGSLIPLFGFFAAWCHVRMRLCALNDLLCSSHSAASQMIVEGSRMRLVSMLLLCLSTGQVMISGGPGVLPELLSLSSPGRRGDSRLLVCVAGGGGTPHPSGGTPNRCSRCCIQTTVCTFCYSCRVYAVFGRLYMHILL